MATTQERLHRCLSLLHCLQRGPADREWMLTFAEIELGGEAYDPDKSDKAQQRIFEGDIKFLREVMQVDLPGYDRNQAIYELRGFGAFTPLYLTDEELDTLAFLSEAFQPGAPNSEAVQRLLYRLQDLMPAPQRDALASRRHRLQMDLRRRDGDEIDPRVEEAVERAMRGHRLLRFAYRAPGQDDGMPRTHTVEPWNRFFDPARGHLYLDAYRRKVEGPYGVWEEGQWQKYRLGRILAEGIQVLPDKFASVSPKRPRYRLDYWLAPEVARLGVTRHFDEMKVLDTDADGWIHIGATTDDLFRACRLLLGYGPNCRVEGGPEARKEMEALVEGMYAVYGIKE